MKYPKTHTSTFLLFAEYDCRQVNLHKGRIYNYWWIEPSEKPVKLVKGQVPDLLKGHDLTELGSF